MTKYFVTGDCHGQYDKIKFSFHSKIQMMNFIYLYLVMLV